MVPESGTAPMSRRRLLGLGGAGVAVTALAGCGIGSDRGSDQPRRRAFCVPRSSLTSRAELAGLPLVYEVSHRRASFSFEDGFFAQLEQWLKAYEQSSGLAPADQVWSYGGWTNSGSACDSWHNAGRAFDLARVRLRSGDFISCRYDRWQYQTGAELDRARRQYWALAAGLHLHFAYVLTYLYNSAHRNHIHVDNGRSGAALSTFTTGSQVQVQAVQAICSYLWDEPTELTGRWDSATRRVSRRALDRAEISDNLDVSVQSWRKFLTASMSRGQA